MEAVNPLLSNNIHFTGSTQLTSSVSIHSSPTFTFNPAVVDMDGVSDTFPTQNEAGQTIYGMDLPDGAGFWEFEDPPNSITYTTSTRLGIMIQVLNSLIASNVVLTRDSRRVTIKNFHVSNRTYEIHGETAFDLEPFTIPSGSSVGSRGEMHFATDDALIAGVLYEPNNAQVVITPPPGYASLGLSNLSPTDLPGEVSESIAVPPTLTFTPSTGLTSFSGSMSGSFKGNQIGGNTANVVTFEEASCLNTSDLERNGVMVWGVEGGPGPNLHYYSASQWWDIDLV